MTYVDKVSLIQACLCKVGNDGGSGEAGLGLIAGAPAGCFWATWPSNLWCVDTAKQTVGLKRYIQRKRLTGLNTWFNKFAVFKRTTCIVLSQLYYTVNESTSLLNDRLVGDKVVTLIDCDDMGRHVCYGGSLWSRATIRWFDLEEMVKYRPTTKTNFHVMC